MNFWTWLTGSLGKGSKPMAAEAKPDGSDIRPAPSHAMNGEYGPIPNGWLTDSDRRARRLREEARKRNLDFLDEQRLRDEWNARVDPLGLNPANPFNALNPLSPFHAAPSFDSPSPSQSTSDSDSSSSCSSSSQDSNSSGGSDSGGSCDSGSSGGSDGGGGGGSSD